MGAVVGGRYELTEVAGSGIGGIVYRAVDRLTGRVVALKAARHLGLSAEEPEDVGGEILPPAALGARLRDEFRTMARLTHPNIVRVYDFGETGSGAPFFTMEFVEGGSIIDACWRDDIDGLVCLVLGVCDALDYVHEKEIVHGDLKPGNILVSRDTRGPGVVKLTDFGLARYVTEMVENRALFGTIPYLSPEAIAGRPCNGRSDLYSLGVILYQALAGSLPFEGSWRDILDQHLHRPPPRLHERASHVSVELSEIVGRLLEKSLARRIHSAAALSSELRAILEEKGSRLLRRGRELGDGDFVGREAELEQLKEIALRARGGAGQVAVITGEEGIGTTRLLREFMSWAQVQGFFVIDVMQERGADAADSLVRGLRRSEGLAETQLSAAAEADLDAIGELLQHASERVPIAVIIDEFDRSDAVSAGILHYAARRTTDLPVMICVGVSHRGEGEVSSDALDNVEEIPGATAIHLTGLEREEIRRLVGSMARCRVVGKELVRLLESNTGGNPLLVKECLKSLASRGAVWFEEGECDLVAGEHEIVAPPSVEEAVLARLQGMSGAAREVAELVAVAGGRCYLGAIADLVGLGENVRSEALAELARSAIIVFDSPGETCQFTHRLYGRAIYSRVPVEKRTTWHAEMAARLEREQEASKDEIADDLAYHWLGAGDREMARWYLAQAGDRACGAHLVRRAIGLFEQALALGPSPAERAPLEEKVGDLQALCGRTSNALASYAQARSSYCAAAGGSCEAVVDRARLFHKSGRLCERRGQAWYDDAEESYRKALDLYESASHVAGAAGVRIDLGWLSSQRGEHEQGLRMCERARQILAERDEEELARALTAMGLIYLKIGEVDAAARCLHQSLEVAERSGDGRELARAHHNLGMSYLDTGDWRRAVDEFERAIAIQEELGNVGAVARYTNSLGACLVEHGEWDRARQVLERAIVLGRRCENVSYVRRATRNLGAGYYLRGRDLERAARCYEEFLSLEETPQARARTMLLLGAIYYEKGEWDRAVGHYVRALRLSARHAERERMGGIYCNLGVLYGKRGDRRRATACFSK
ncbi:hypothetical protein AMJ71_10665, partial [candidate division TA06 bacterium SM1_40]